METIMMIGLSGLLGFLMLLIVGVRVGEKESKSDAKPSTMEDHNGGCDFL